ncbi:hypothetical protein JCM8097_007418 [Rhodosporidiobolus ruineniae]
MELAAAIPTSDLRLLQVRLDNLDLLLQQHKQLLARLEEVQRAREDGNGTMTVAVDLHPEFSVQGVVEDTSRIICAAGLDDLFLDLPLDKAQAFLEKRVAILEKKQKDLKEPIARMKKEYALIYATAGQTLSCLSSTGKAGSESGRRPLLLEPSERY